MAVDPTEPARLLRELQVHQLELEMQNRQLIEAHTLLEESRASYVELYDLAPVGYVTLDRVGAIRQINLAGADLLKRARAESIRTPLPPVSVAREPPPLRRPPAAVVC